MRDAPSHSIDDVVTLKQEGDIVTRLSQNYTGDSDLGHILGPKKGSVISVCKRMSAMDRYKKLIKAEDNMNCIECS
jgi:hypothetical protein